MNYFYWILITIAGLTSLLPAMEIAPINHKTAILNALEATLQPEKKINPIAYFSKMHKVANVAYASIILDKLLISMKNGYDQCLTFQDSALYNGVFVNGATYITGIEMAGHTISLSPEAIGFQEERPFAQVPHIPLLEYIDTDLGRLKEYSPPGRKDKEWTILINSTKERAFLHKLHKLHAAALTAQSTGNIPLYLSHLSQALAFFHKHINDNDINIKTLANNFSYFISHDQTLSSLGIATIASQEFKSQSTQKYCSEDNLNLRLLFTQELFIQFLAQKSCDEAAETAPSLIEKLYPVCNNPKLSAIVAEYPGFYHAYQILITTLQNQLAQYALLIENKQKGSRYLTTLNQLTNKYLSLAPEFSHLWKLFKLSHLLPGVSAVVIPPQQFQPSNVSPKKSAKKGKSRAKTKKAQLVNLQTLANSTNNSTTRATTTTALPQAEAIIPKTDSTSYIFDSRVLGQNSNKNDPYHGFTLLTVPYIMKYGTLNRWANRTTGHNDNLMKIQGELLYEGSNKPIFVNFALCTGQDGAIYHIEMKKQRYNEDTSKQQYDINFPPLGTTNTVSHDSSLDDYGSHVLIENDYMVQIWDGGLNATITLYK